MKTTRRYGLVVGLLTVSVMAGSGAQGGDYPEKVVQIIEDFGCREHARRGFAVCCG